MILNKTIKKVTIGQFHQPTTNQIKLFIQGKQSYDPNKSRSKSHRAIFKFFSTRHLLESVSRGMAWSLTAIFIWMLFDKSVKQLWKLFAEIVYDNLYLRKIFCVDGYCKCFHFSDEKRKEKIFLKVNDVLTYNFF